MKLVNDISRRVQVQHRTELETEIHNIIGKVEDLGAHEKLTDVVVHLHDAFNALADWEDMDRPGAAIPNGFLNARGAIPWKEGDEPAEVTIRRLRDT